jgi:hypothetical protein
VTLAGPGTYRELASREQGGITVRLVWSGATNQVLLAYADERERDEFVASVPRERALEAFRHPNLFRPGIRRRPALRGGVRA